MSMQQQVDKQLNVYKTYYNRFLSMVNQYSNNLVYFAGIGDFASVKRYVECEINLRYDKDAALEAAIGNSHYNIAEYIMNRNGFMNRLDNKLWIRCMNAAFQHDNVNESFVLMLIENIPNQYIDTYDSKLVMLVSLLAEKHAHILYLMCEFGYTDHIVYGLVSIRDLQTLHCLACAGYVDYTKYTRNAYNADNIFKHFVLRDHDFRYAEIIINQLFGSENESFNVRIKKTIIEHAIYTNSNKILSICRSLWDMSVFIDEFVQFGNIDAMTDFIITYPESRFNDDHIATMFKRHGVIMRTLLPPGDKNDYGLISTGTLNRSDDAFNVIVRTHNFPDPYLACILSTSDIKSIKFIAEYVSLYERLPKILNDTYYCSLRRHESSKSRRNNCSFGYCSSDCDSSDYDSMGYDLYEEGNEIRGFRCTVNTRNMKYKVLKFISRIISKFTFDEDVDLMYDSDDDSCYSDHGDHTDTDAADITDGVINHVDSNIDDDDVDDTSNFTSGLEHLVDIHIPTHPENLFEIIAEINDNIDFLAKFRKQDDYKCLYNIAILMIGYEIIPDKYKVIRAVSECEYKLASMFLSKWKLDSDDKDYNIRDVCEYGYHTVEQHKFIDSLNAKYDLEERIDNAIKFANYDSIMYLAKKFKIHLKFILGNTRMSYIGAELFAYCKKNNIEIQSNTLPRGIEKNFTLDEFKKFSEYCGDDEISVRFISESLRNAFEYQKFELFEYIVDNHTDIARELCEKYDTIGNEREAAIASSIDFATKIYDSNIKIRYHVFRWYMFTSTTPVNIINYILKRCDEFDDQFGIFKYLIQAKNVEGVQYMIDNRPGNWEHKHICTWMFREWFECDLDTFDVTLKIAKMVSKSGDLRSDEIKDNVSRRQCTADGRRIYRSDLMCNCKGDDLIAMILSELGFAVNKVDCVNERERYTQHKMSSELMQEISDASMRYATDITCHPDVIAANERFTTQSY